MSVADATIQLMDETGITASEPERSVTHFGNDLWVVIVNPMVEPRAATEAANAEKEILQDKTLTQQIRQATKDLEAGNKDAFVPWSEIENK